jgi:hypothetical protein
MSLGLLPVRFTVKDVVIAEDSAFKSKFPFIQAQQLDVRVSLLSLLTGNVKVHSIDLNQPSVELIRDKKGIWNFASVSAGTTPGAPLPPPARHHQAARPTSRRNPQLRRKPHPLRVQPESPYDSRRQNSDNGFDEEPTSHGYEPIDVTLRDYEAGQPFSFDVTAHIPGEGSQNIHVKGTAGPLPPDGPAAMPLKATAELNNIDIAGLHKFLDSEVVSKAVGTLSGETQIESQSGKLSAKGKMNLKDAKGRRRGHRLSHRDGLRRVIGSGDGYL